MPTSSSESGKRRTVLFYMGHPAHYHLFSQLADLLNQRGYKVVFAVREKDIILDLVKDSTYTIRLTSRRRRNNKLSILWELICRALTFVRLNSQFRPELLVGSDVVLVQVGRLLRKPVIFLNEDDAHIVPLVAKLGFRYASVVLSPISCDLGNYGDHKVGYAGYQKMSYLHPRCFRPDAGRLTFRQHKSEGYFLIRLVELSAHHDSAANGITDDVLRSIIKSLTTHGRVFLSCERKIPLDLQKFALRLDPRDIHHAISFAEIFISDSQSMTVEAAILGTPSIRFSDFAGRIGVLEELEHRYGLTYGIKTSDPERLMQKIDHLLQMESPKLEWRKRRDRMLSEKIDVTQFLVWFVENYPDSHAIMKTQPDYQWNFLAPIASSDIGRSQENACATKASAR